MKKITITIFLFLVGHYGHAAETFSNAETNFKLVMQKLMDKYIDKNISRDKLYEAATAGMLKGLNSGEQSWNTLLSPQELLEMQGDLSGKISGIGAEMKFEETTGYALILKVYAKSPAESAGIKPDDQILSVNGQKFKGKPFSELVSAVRGETGKSVNLKILREDKILNLDVKRDTIAWTPVSLDKIDESTALLTIGYFTVEAPKLVEEKLLEVTKQKYKKLIVDVRGNNGGGFEQAVKVAELFLPRQSIVASTKNRDGKVHNHLAEKNLLPAEVQVILLANKETKSGAELFTASLKENLHARLVGENTFGKWNVQSLEVLANKFAIKYTVSEFLSPQGHSFQDKGITPDVEVELPKSLAVGELRSKYDIPQRIAKDTQLKAALELLR